MLCKKDQYYETALQRCRSCKIPCMISKAECKAMGCERNQENLSSKTHFQPTSTQASVNGGPNNGIKKAVNQPTVIFILSPATLAVASLLLIVLIVALAFMIKGKWPFSKTIVLETSKSDKEYLQVVLTSESVIRKNSQGSSGEPLLPDVSDSKPKTVMKVGTQPDRMPTIIPTNGPGDQYYYGSANKLAV